MLKHEITYEDFNDEKVTETLYFNISKTELMELEVEHPEGMHDWLQRMVKIEDKKKLFAEFKRIILLSYGEKSPDGKRFIKSDEIRNDFEHSAAFEALFVSLIESEDTVAKFITNVLPKDLQEDVKKAASEREAQKAVAAETSPTPNS